jgi:hypothetical protein
MSFLFYRNHHDEFHAMLLEDEEDEIFYTPPLIERLATSSENLRESFIPCELTGNMENIREN